MTHWKRRAAALLGAVVLLTAGGLPAVTVPVAAAPQASCSVSVSHASSTTSLLSTDSSVPAGVESTPPSDTAKPEPSMSSPSITAGSGNCIDEFSLPTGSSPGSIILGPDGNLWFLLSSCRTCHDVGGNDVGRILSHAPSTVTLFPIPTPDSGAGDLTVGPDGNIWFVEQGSVYYEADGSPGKIGRILAYAPYTITEFETPNPNSRPSGIAVGPDGALWFGEYWQPNLGGGGNAIGRIWPFPPYRMSEYPAPAAGDAPVNVVAGPDHTVWFTEVWGNKIASIETDRNHRITEFSIPTAPVLAPGFPATSFPWDLTRDSDGNIWFAERQGNNIGRMSVRGDHRLTEFALPTADSWPYGITAAHDHIWFTEFLNNKIAKIDDDGRVSEFDIPAASSGPLDLAAGPDRSIWFVELNGGKIGRLETRPCQPWLGQLEDCDR